MFNVTQKVKQSSSNLSLNKNTSSNSLQANSPSPPKKPERSFIESGNNGDIFKFDCRIERNSIKQSNGSLDKVGANQNSDERRAAEKKKKKEKKEKREKKDKKRSKVESDIIETTTRHDIDLGGNNRNSVSEFVDIDFENDCEDIEAEAPATNWQIEVTPPKSYERSSTNISKSKSMGDHRLPIT